MEIRITSEPIDVNACIAQAMSPGCGGIDVFIGTVRNATKGRRVVRLEFEAYESMALRELEKIAGTAMARWPLLRLVVHHRVGVLAVGASRWSLP